MNIVIVEDETFAAKRLENLLQAYCADYRVVATLESVEASIEWFSNNVHPDLIFLDLHLEDDLSLVLFQKVSVLSPIVLTTATDEHFLKSFNKKRMVYLHKPIVQDELNLLLDNIRKNGLDSLPTLDAQSLNDLISQK